MCTAHRPHQFSLLRAIHCGRGGNTCLRKFSITIVCRSTHVREYSPLLQFDAADPVCSRGFFTLMCYVTEIIRFRDAPRGASEDHAKGREDRPRSRDSDKSQITRTRCGRRQIGGGVMSRAAGNNIIIGPRASFDVSVSAPCRGFSTRRGKARLIYHRPFSCVLRHDISRMVLDIGVAAATGKKRLQIK